MVNLVSIVHTTARWMALQQRLFRRFCGVDVIFVDNQLQNPDILAEANRLGARCIQVPEHGQSNPSLSHSAALAVVAHQFLFSSPDPLCIVDMDLMPIRPVDLAAKIDGYHAYGERQGPNDCQYLWPGLLMFSADAPARDEIRLEACEIDGEWRDSGGALAHWTRKHRPTIREICSRPLVADDLPEHLRGQYDDEYRFEFKDEDFFHLRFGTNWYHWSDSLQDARTDLANKYLVWISAEAALNE